MFEPTLNNIIAALFAICVVGPTVWWSLDRAPPFEVIAADPIPNPAKPEDIVDLRWTVVVHKTGCYVTWQRQTLDSDNRERVYVFGETGFDKLPVGKHHTDTTAQYQVPRGTFDGDMRVYTAYSSICNPVQYLFPVNFRSVPAIIHVKK